MSYDLGLREPLTNEWCVLSERHHMRGGTYRVGGCPTAEINITYNYGKHFRKIFKKRNSEHEYRDDEGYLTGIRSIYGLSGVESIPILKNAIDQLGDDVTNRHWDATEGNVKKSLLQCLALAQMRPDGIWDGD